MIEAINKKVTELARAGVFRSYNNAGAIFLGPGYADELLSEFIPSLREKYPTSDEAWIWAKAMQMMAAGKVEIQTIAGLMKVYRVENSNLKFVEIAVFPKKDERDDFL